MLIQIKVYACFTVKITKTNPKDFQNRGAHAQRTGPGSAFGQAVHLRAE